ncbi:hypothetical protein [Nostoc linckia]|nr:hypothetical protein [Nostoc linckia]
MGRPQDRTASPMPHAQSPVKASTPLSLDPERSRRVNTQPPQVVMLF